jgi:hypothetical protein
MLPACDHFSTKGLATIVCAKRLFTPAFSEIPANENPADPLWW